MSSSKESRLVRAAYIRPNIEVPASQRAPLRPQAHGKCGVCGSTVMTAQEWWLCGHQTGRCLGPRKTMGHDEYNALFC